MLRFLFPILYGAAFVTLLWQAFRVMSRGFKTDSLKLNTKKDRTGKVTTHPELLDSEGRITEEDLLVVRFSEEDSEPTDSHGTKSQ